MNDDLVDTPEALLLHDVRGEDVETHRLLREVLARLDALAAVVANLAGQIAPESTQRAPDVLP